MPVQLCRPRRGRGGDRKPAGVDGSHSFGNIHQHVPGVCARSRESRVAVPKQIENPPLSLSAAQSCLTPPVGFDTSGMGREQREKFLDSHKHAALPSVAFTAGSACEDEEMNSNQKSSVHEARRRFVRDTY